MKKIIISFFTIINLLLNISTAQNNKFTAETYVGLNGGATGSMVYFRPTINQDYLLAYHGGFVFRYISEKHLGVQAELNYVQKGWQEVDESYAKRLDYIEIPFLTHLSFGNKAQVYFNLGPKIGYLIHEQELLNINPASTEAQHESIENKFDYGFAVGLGLLFKVKKQVLQIDSRANYSISDIFSNERRDYFDNSNNLNVSLSLAWLFRVK
jgi:hypothetical protein